jgi:hypothetical protein
VIAPPSRTIVAAALAGVLATSAGGHDPAGAFEDDYGLLGRWVFRADDAGARRIRAETGNTAVLLHGDLQCLATPDGAALLGEGLTGWGRIEPAALATAPSQPKRAFTVSAWAQVEEPARWGGLIGRLQDNGELEKGWLLGYVDDRFCFALSTTGADDGDGKLTYLKAGAPFERSRWHHVAATYDGATMRLYVDGVEAARSGEQSGDILHPETAPYVIGCYRDDNEHYPLAGALQHLRVYRRALDAAAIEQVMLAAPSMQDAAALTVPFRMIVGPYLQHSTQTSMTVRFETNRPATGRVEYGRTHPPGERAAAESATGMHEIRLDDLEPETQYFYRVSAEGADGEIVAAEESTFKTAVRDDSAFAFVVMSDTQNNPEVTRLVADWAWRHRPNFIIHCGDLVGTGEIKREWVYEFFGSAADVLRRFPIFPTLGNHERDAQLYYDYFTLPEPEYHYEYRYGNAHFFVLDTNKDVSPASDQHRWLTRRLAASEATWKIVYHHQPAFTSDANDYGDTYVEASTFGDASIQQHLVPVYEANGVDVVFNGHIHVYERTWPLRGGRVDQENGIVYVTAGGSGGSLEDFAPTRTGFAAHVFRGHHYCVVTVHAGTFSMKAYDIDGVMFDTLELRK